MRFRRIFTAFCPYVRYAVYTAYRTAIAVMMHFVPLLSSVYTDSQETIWTTQKSVTLLVDADRRELKYITRAVLSQHSFGFRVGIFGFISIGTAQEILSTAISYSLLLITLMKVSRIPSVQCETAGHRW